MMHEKMPDLILPSITLIKINNFSHTSFRTPREKIGEKRNPVERGYPLVIPEHSGETVNNMRTQA